MFDDVKMTLTLPGREPIEDVYAKVLSVEGGTARVRLTSVPEDRRDDLAEV